MEILIPTGEVWVDTAPTEEGDWLMQCFETDFETETVKVRMMRGELWAVDCAIGSLPVAMYHDGLIECRWQKCQSKNS